MKFSCDCVQAYDEEIERLEEEKETKFRKVQEEVQAAEKKECEY